MRHSGNLGTYQGSGSFVSRAGGRYKTRFLLLWFEYERSTHTIHVWNAWFSAGGTVLGGGGGFRRWGLAGRSRSLGVCI
jgi:hypothetical protein